MIVIMEFLDGHDLLDHALVAKESCNEYNEEKIAGYLGDFMGRVHSATHSSNVTKERREYLTKHFENREMRDVQLEFVFTKCYKEATNEQRSGLTLTSEFMNEVELLKNQYNGVGGGNSNAGAGGHHVLCHGDLHPGSVMVNTLNGSTKVIDPEFTVYGPAGLDVGSLLHGYCLGAIHQAYSNNPNAVERIISSAETLWNSYKKALMENGNGNDGENGISADTMKEIEIETVGFTVAEVCRTALEFAGGRLWLQFDDVETKSASKKAALRLVDKCMIARHTGGMDLLFNELKNICSSI
jgi:5-methylthioribose kinase